VDHLDLVLTNGYLGKPLSNARVVRYLAQHQQPLRPVTPSVTSWNAYVRLRVSPSSAHWRR
jgi:hypothetical protein